VFLGICGPIDTEPFRAWLTDPPNRLPKGLGGTPVTDLARAAIEAGWRVAIFSLDTEVREEVILQGPGLKIYLGPFRPRYRARDLFSRERAYLSRAIRRVKPAIVHAHWTYEFALGAIESGVPTVVTAHDAPLRVLRLNPTPYRLIRTLMAAQVARRARCLTAVSPMVADHFRRCFRYTAPICVIPNGIPEEWFRKDPAAGCPQGISYASVLNGWGVLKNGKTILEAFRLVRASLSECELFLFGAGHGPGEEAEGWARQRGLGENVRFIGAVDRPTLLRRLKEQITILVHPSLEESFSMAIAEAMALGLPVIAGKNSGAVSDTLDAGRCGILTDVRSPEALGSEMLRLARSPGLRAHLGRAAADSAGKKFHMKAILDAYADVYRAARAGAD
jgi:glycosyltransferase involved in cell wall biosynthesis